MAFVPTGGGSRRARARRVLTATLRRAGATNESAAVPLVPASRSEERELERLLHDGAIRPGRDGGYWLDVERLRELRHARLRIVAMILIVEFGVIAALLLNAPRHHG